MIPDILRKRRLQFFLIVLVLTLFLLWQVRDALTPFLLGLVIAYLILPLVNLVQRYLPQAAQGRRFTRPLAIMIVYLFIILLIAGAIATVVPPIVDQLASLDEITSKLSENATKFLEQGLEQYEQFDPETKKQIEEQVQAFEPMTILNPLFSGVTRTLSAITNTVSFIIGLIVIPFWLFFILNDEKTVVNGTMLIIPHDLRADVEAVRIIFARILSAYIRGQLFLASMLGLVISIGLWLLNVPYWLLLGLAAGLLGIFPFIGAILGAVPAIFVAFVQRPTLALWVVGLFAVVQQIDNVFLSPKVMGEAVSLHPAIIMVVIVVGTSAFGIIGALVAVPLTAILRDITHYLYLRADDQDMTPIEVLDIVGYGKWVTPLMGEAIVEQKEA